MIPRRAYAILSRSWGVSLALLTGGLLAACEGGRSPLAPLPPAPHATISDAANGGTAGFYFLSPLVPDPVVAGTFDADLSPTVVVCQPVAAGCGEVVVRFDAATSPALTVNTKDEAYGVVWQTKDAGLDPTLDLRIRVSVGSVVLGYADVDVVATAKDAKAVGPGMVALVAGRPLPIRFRIETGIAGSIEVTPTESLLGVGSTLALSASVLDLHGQALPGATVTWSSSDGSVSVDADGTAHGTSAGEAVVKASVGPASDAASLTVVGPLVFVRNFINGSTGTSAYYIQTLGQEAQLLATATEFLPGTPQWRPDGSMILLNEGGKISTINADGTGRAQIGTGYSAVWSPAGDRIAYAYNANTASDPYGGELFVMDANGTNIVQVTSTDPGPREISWSPDGSRIAFSRGRGVSGIYTIAPDGTGLTDVVSAELAPLNPLSWSADGTHLLYAARGPNLVDLVPDIFVIVADGAHQPVDLTNTSSQVDLQPAWSPDGAHILFVRFNGWLTEPSLLVLMNVDGSGKTAISEAVETTGSGAWSPDGRVIAYTRPDAQNVRQIYLVKPDGTLLTQLTSGSTGSGTPVWKP